MMNNILLRRRFKYEILPIQITPSDNELAYIRYNEYIRNKLFNETTLPENYITNMNFINENL